MNIRENSLAILNYQNFDSVPVYHFGFWGELVWEWYHKGLITEEELRNHGKVAEKLGFDCEWTCFGGANCFMLYGFEQKELERTADGFIVYQNSQGLIEKRRDGAGSIPATVGTLLKDREAWETLYKPRFAMSAARYGSPEHLAAVQKNIEKAVIPAGYHVGSLYGNIRNMVGVEELSYLAVDDFELYIEIIDTIGKLSVDCMKAVFDAGVKPDFLHYWEDICFKNGPLVHPAVFREYVAPYYKQVSDIANAHGTKFSSLDCDGCIDQLVPIWLESGVNVMFPIEVGTWNASIEKWRNLYGKEIRGIGGMNKLVLGEQYDYAAIDAEIERLRRLVDLGGFIPCPDHRLPLGTKWENVQYYCDKMRKVFQ